MGLMKGGLDPVTVACALLLSGNQAAFQPFLDLSLSRQQETFVIWIIPALHMNYPTQTAYAAMDGVSC